MQTDDLLLNRRSDHMIDNKMKYTAELWILPSRETTE